MKMIRNGKIRMKILTMASLLYLVTLSVVSAEGTTIDTSDNVAMTFWIATALMLASTVFFVLERQNVSDKWKTSMTVAALVTGVAWYHYTYMRDHWVITAAANDGVGNSPLVLRYVDWLITVPLQVSEFYLILAAVGVASAALFFRLFGASIIMLVSGFIGESGIIGGSAWMWFAIGMVAWFYIIYEIWAGDAKNKVSETSEGTQFAFKAMAFILTVGWAIYPIGYVMGQNVDFGGEDGLNILYNLADAVNKTAFGLMVWYAATMDTKAEKAAAAEN
jgi:bacteriorhodopsin|tara:strand:+ start:467 stop:1297 length:831 start_codon:yes stop_codon:yes gene_type:complete